MKSQNAPQDIPKGRNANAATIHEKNLLVTDTSNTKKND
jgi:hypothetical protein